MKLELIMLPVSDVDRAKAFYLAAGFRLDVDNAVGENWRAVHLTPPGSEGSIMFGKGITTAPPGSTQGIYLIVPDVEQARADLVGRGIEVSEVFHDSAGVFVHGHDGKGEFTYPADTSTKREGPHPDRAAYGSYATFTDPDGNGWVLQEVGMRAPGRSW
ncbi:VOC family protein [Catellatospora citrea]|uniref:VOC family protein n=1 Tax=Catellatospora citrea TaxID=53366 RepID=UPI0033F9D493